MNYSTPKRIIRLGRKLYTDLTIVWAYGSGVLCAYDLFMEYCLMDDITIIIECV